MPLRAGSCPEGGLPWVFEVDLLAVHLHEVLECERDGAGHDLFGSWRQECLALCTRIELRLLRRLTCHQAVDEGAALLLGKLAVKLVANIAVRLDVVGTWLAEAQEVFQGLYRSVVEVVTLEPQSREAPRPVTRATQPSPPGPRQPARRGRAQPPAAPAPGAATTAHEPKAGGCCVASGQAGR